jgi:SWI/SNF-related matrix-associated actin-dependent regulator 1 of chromatin subfamily A
MPYQKEAYEWLKGKHYALLADEPGVGKTCSAILWAADLRPALVIAPANAVINWAEKEIKGMWRPDDSVILLDGKQDFPKKLPDWVVMSYGMMDKYLDDMKIAGFQSIVVDEAHMVKNMTAKRTQHLLNLVEPDEYEKLRIADLNGDTAKVERLQKRIAKLRPIPNRLAVTGTPVLNRPIELFALLMFLGLKKRKDYKEFVETYTVSEEGRHGTIWKGAKNLDQLYDYMKPFMLRRYKKDVLKDLPPKVNKSMFVPITNAKEYREAETNFLSWLAENKGEEAASRAVDAEVIVQMNTLRQLAAVGKVQPVADWMKPCSMTGSKMLVFSSFTEPLQELNRIKEPLSALYTGADSKEQRQKVIEQFQHDPGLCFFLGTVGAAGVAITLTAADRVAFLDLPWTPGGKIQAEDRAHRRGQKKTVEVYNVLAKGTIDERMLELLAQKEQIIAQAVDGKTIDEANAGSIANSLMQSFITAPNLSDTIEEYVPDKPDEDMNEIEDEIIQGVMSDSSYSGEITYPKNTMKGYQLDDSATVTPTSIIPKEWAKYTVSLKLERSPEWSAEKAPIVQSPRDCQRFFTEMRKADREYCLVICVDTHHHLIGLFELSIGDNDSALVNAMEVCRIAAKSGAVDVLMAHNHPSGDPTPSDADREVFKKVRDALVLMRVQLLDFFVVGQHQDYGIAFDTRIAVQGTLEDSIVAHLFDHDYTYLAKKLDHCNLSERDQVQIFGWRPLRNFLSWATSRKEPVQVCAAGMTHGVYQITILGVAGSRDSDISMRVKSVPGLKRVFTQENNAVFEIVVPEETDKPLEWQPQEVSHKAARKEPVEQTALFDKSTMLRSDPVNGEVSSVDIPLSCGSRPVDPIIRKAIHNAEEIE